MSDAPEKPGVYTFEFDAVALGEILAQHAIEHLGVPSGEYKMQLVSDPPKGVIRLVFEAFPEKVSVMRKPPPLSSLGKRVT